MTTPSVDPTDDDTTLTYADTDRFMEAVARLKVIWAGALEELADR